jgi:DNA-binding GntR family transcriptional regulator
LERIYRHHKDVLQAVIDQDVERSRKLLSEHSSQCQGASR